LKLRRAHVHPLGYPAGRTRHDFQAIEWHTFIHPLRFCSISRVNASNSRAIASGSLRFVAGVAGVVRASSGACRGGLTARPVSVNTRSGAQVAGWLQVATKLHDSHGGSVSAKSVR
jgi:hypothetical protein